MSFTVNQRINVPGKPGIQGVIQSRREEQKLTIPAITTLTWVGEDGQHHAATFNDVDLKAANQKPAPEAAKSKSQRK